MPQPQPPPSTPTKARGIVSPLSVVTPQAVRSGLAKSPEAMTPRGQFRQETGGSTLANGRTSKTPSPDVTNSKGMLKGRSQGRSPTSPRPPSSLSVRSADDKFSPDIPRKISPGTPSKISPSTPRNTLSPKELHLLKFASSPIS